MAENAQNNGRILSTALATQLGCSHEQVVSAIESVPLPPSFLGRHFERMPDPSPDNFVQYSISADGVLILPLGDEKKREVIAAKVEYVKPDYIVSRTGAANFYSQRILNDCSAECPNGYWCVFDECHRTMLLIEKFVGCDKFDLVDGSIGHAWSLYRKNEGWEEPSGKFKFRFNDKRSIRFPSYFSNSELAHFRTWLTSVYEKEHLVPYLERKYKNNKVRLAGVDALREYLDTNRT